VRALSRPVIGHLKEDHRLSRNYYKGITGDEINVMLAAAGFNFKRMMNKWKSSFRLFLEKIFLFLNRQLYPIRDSIILQTRKKWAF
jgi:IS5 family transposase